MKLVVTGSSGQVGLSLVCALQSLGHEVLSFDKDSDNVLDITDEDAVSSFWGDNNDIDCLINNAGIGVFTSSFLRTKFEFFEVLNTNLWGTFNMSINYLRHTPQKHFKKIINLASIYGHISSDFRIYGDSKRNNSEVYSASKAGVISLTKYFATNFSNHNLVCNSVSPGGIIRNQSQDFLSNYSNKSPQSRLCNVDEVVGLIVFLATSAPNHLNGEDIKIDGGFSQW